MRDIMKIARVECLPVHSGWRKNFVFVRIETAAGIVGWGEAYSQYDRDRAVAAQVEELARYLIGRDSFHIRHILQIGRSDDQKIVVHDQEPLGAVALLHPLHFTGWCMD